MSFLKKILKRSSNKEEETGTQEIFTALDESFVHHFIEKGGKFLYCASIKEVVTNLSKILHENVWTEITALDYNLSGLLRKTEASRKLVFNKETPVFTTCEHLISDNGDILFSSNQLNSYRLAELSDNFIVYATTSQLVRNTGQGLTGIKANFKENIPTNISAIKNYCIKKNDDNFLNYGNTNSKNLYLLLFEDL
jgi:L-lactate utilization protein LutC